METTQEKKPLRKSNIILRTAAVLALLAIFENFFFRYRALDGSLLFFSLSSMFGFTLLLTVQFIVAYKGIKKYFRSNRNTSKVSLSSALIIGVFSYTIGRTISAAVLVIVHNISDSVLAPAVNTMGALVLPVSIMTASINGFIVGFIAYLALNYRFRSK